MQEGWGEVHGGGKKSDTGNEGYERGILETSLSRQRSMIQDGGRGVVVMY